MHKKDLYLALSAQELNIGWQQCGRAKAVGSPLMSEKWQPGDWQRYVGDVKAIAEVNAGCHVKQTL